MANLTVYGAEWCGDCRRSKKQLDDLGVAYDYVDLEDQANASAIDTVIELNGGKRSIPVIVFADGSHVTEPTNIDLEAKLKEHALI